MVSEIKFFRGVCVIQTVFTDMFHTNNFIDFYRYCTDQR